LVSDIIGAGTFFPSRIRGEAIPPSGAKKEKLVQIQRCAATVFDRKKKWSSARAPASPDWLESLLGLRRIELETQLMPGGKSCERRSEIKRDPTIRWVFVFKRLPQSV
jgi:hypothetical protein